MSKSYNENRISCNSSSYHLSQQVVYRSTNLALTISLEMLHYLELNLEIYLRLIHLECLWRFLLCLPYLRPSWLTQQTKGGVKSSLRRPSLAMDLVPKVMSKPSLFSQSKSAKLSLHSFVKTKMVIFRSLRSYQRILLVNKAKDQASGNRNRRTKISRNSQPKERVLRLKAIERSYLYPCSHTLMSQNLPKT